MGGEIHLDKKQQHAMHFASILRSAGFIDAANYLENIYVKPVFGGLTGELWIDSFEFQPWQKEVFKKLEEQSKLDAGTRTYKKRNWRRIY